MPSVQRRVSPNGKVSYRALVRLKGHKPKTATFLKKADAVTWAQETETKVKQNCSLIRLIHLGKFEYHPDYQFLPKLLHN